MPSCPAGRSGAARNAGASAHSEPGIGPGDRAEDAADLATLIEHLGDGPVHVAGNSYGAIVTLTLVTTRPELVASAAVHEPPVLELLEGSLDPDIVAVLAVTFEETARAGED